MGANEIKSYIETGKTYASEANERFAWLNDLPPHVKAQYDYLTKKLASSELSDTGRQDMLRQIEDLIKPYQDKTTN